MSEKTTARESTSGPLTTPIFSTLSGFRLAEAWNSNRASRVRNHHLCVLLAAMWGRGCIGQWKINRRASTYEATTEPAGAREWRPICSGQSSHALMYPLAQLRLSAMLYPVDRRQGGVGSSRNTVGDADGRIHLQGRGRLFLVEGRSTGPSYTTTPASVR